MLPHHNTPASPEFMPKPELSHTQMEILRLASLGKTVGDVAYRFRTTDSEIISIRDSVSAIFESPNMAATIHLAIVRGVLPIKVNPESVDLNEVELNMLCIYASGQDHLEVSAQFGIGEKQVATLNKELFRKIGATGRTHSIRRAYELGIFKIDS